MTDSVGEGLPKRYRPSRRVVVGTAAVAALAGALYGGWRATHSGPPGPAQFSASLDCTQPGLNDNVFEAVFPPQGGELTINTPNQPVGSNVTTKVISHAGKLTIGGFRPDFTPNAGGFRLVPVPTTKAYQPGNWVESLNVASGTYDVFGGLATVANGTVTWQNRNGITVTCDEFPLPDTQPQGDGVTINAQETPAP